MGSAKRNKCVQLRTNFQTKPQNNSGKQRTKCCVGTIDQSVQNPCKESNKIRARSLMTPCTDFALIGQSFQSNTAVSALFSRIVLGVCFKFCSYLHTLCFDLLNPLHIFFCLCLLVLNVLEITRCWRSPDVARCVLSCQS